MGVMFIPAAVRVFYVIIFGYWAGIGIAIWALIDVLAYYKYTAVSAYVALLFLTTGPCQLYLDKAA